MIKGKPIRQNAKITVTDSIGIIIDSNQFNIEVGENILLAYLREVEYHVYGVKISIYTANLVLNAIVKQILKGDNGSTQIIYDDTDSKPMYISYTGYMTEQEANEELQVIMSKRAEYSEALTPYEHIRKIANQDPMIQSGSLADMKK